MQLKQGQCRRAEMRGLSLVELMVGIAVSLFIVAAAALLTSSQLSDNRRLLLETQLQQDLRATADMITRDLRRSSYWQDAANGTPKPDGGIVAPNDLATVSLTTSTSSTVFYRYWRNNDSDFFAFRKTTAGVIQSCQTQASEVGGPCNTVPWQDLTDGRTMEVLEFTIDDERASASNNAALVTLPCPSACADGSATCWPKVGVREFTVFIKARAKSDTTVVRTLKSSVRVRNDLVNLSSEAPANQACPAS